MDADRKGEQAVLYELYRRKSVRSWHESTLFGAHLDGFLAELAEQGFGPNMLRAKLRAISLFGDFLRRRGVNAISSITEAQVSKFLTVDRERRGNSSYAEARNAAIQAMLCHLERKGAWTPPLKPEPEGPTEDFYRSLADERGLKPRSIANYRNYIGRFLRHVGCEGSRAKLALLTAKEVDRFIIEVGPSYSRRSMGHVCSCIRGLLRYLYRADVLSSDLSAGVLTPQYYALERVPCALPWDTVKRLLDVVDTATPKGRRDLGILWLLVTYGLRPGEVERLCLEDIDWRMDVIHVPRSKTGRPLQLPLTREVGEAIIGYLRDCRPKTTYREVFISVRAPYVPMRNRVCSGVVTHYLRKAGIECQRGGAYVIRHSFAVHLLRQGQPLKTITDMFGHADPRSAYHYTKLAIEDLRDVALPAAEVMP